MIFFGFGSREPTRVSSTVLQVSGGKFLLYLFETGIKTHSKLTE